MLRELIAIPSADDIVLPTADTDIVGLVLFSCTVYRCLAQEVCEAFFLAEMTSNAAVLFPSAAAVLPVQQQYHR